MKASPRFSRLLAACAGLWGVGSLAQDVVVTDPVWALSDPAPEQLPKQHGRLRPGYPDEMKAATEPGYVVVVRYVEIDEKMRFLHAVSTHTSFQRAVELEFPDWDMSAAKRAGKPVPGEVWLSALFNPKSASAKGPEATPRLLAVAPVIYTKPKDEKTVPTVVRMKLSLDASGTITSSAPESEIPAPLVSAIQESFKKWRFAPARHNGQAVPAELAMPVVWQPPSRAEMSNYTPPKVLKRVPTTYPTAMRASRMGGAVTLHFDVETNGAIKNPVVVRSNNPGFDEAALEALREWKFAPATRDGQAVKASMNVALQFNIYSTNPGFVQKDAYDVTNRVDMSKLPPEMRYDTPAKVRSTVVPVYPYTFQRDRVFGSASLIMGIDEQGHVVETKIVEASKPEFGLALVAAVESFSFDPALRAAKGVPSVLRFSQDFNGTKPSDSDPNDLLVLEKKHPEKIVSANKLDAPLHPISQRKPVFPVALLGKTETGKAVIEILVDFDGHVRLPRIISTTDEAFGYSAVQAVTAWIFDPPKVGGRAAVTRVQVPFGFSGPPVAPIDTVATEVPAAAAADK